MFDNVLLCNDNPVRKGWGYGWGEVMTELGMILISIYSKSASPIVYSDFACKSHSLSRPKYVLRLVQFSYNFRSFRRKFKGTDYYSCNMERGKNRNDYEKN